MLISLLALASASGLLFSLWLTKPMPVSSVSQVSKEKRITQWHIKVLNDPNSKVDQKITALAELTKKQHSSALQEANKLSQHKNSDLRAAAANTFKSFPSKQNLKKVERLIKDPVNEVSFAAIRALAQNNRADYEEVLFKLYHNKKNLNDLQKIAIFTALMESTKNMEYMERALDGLLEYSKNTNALYGQVARQELARRMWSHPKVMNLMKMFLLAGQDFNFSYFAVEKILKHEKKWLTENLLTVLNNNGTRIIAKIRNKFYDFCPNNLWQAFAVALLKNDGKDMDYFKNTLNALKYYDNHAAKKLLNSLKLPSTFNAQAKKELLRFQKEFQIQATDSPACQ